MTAAIRASVTGSATVIRADARQIPLPDASVDLIITSPPYFGLRSYTDGGVHFESQIGSEATPAEWVDALLACTREWVRVLKPEGSLFVNLGDKYSTGNSGQSGLAELGKRWAGGGHSDGKAKRSSAAVRGWPPKSLLGLPWRYALACIDDLGLILRAEIVWAKPNGLPESVTDRVRRAHEQVFHLVKQPRYYAAVDEIREDYDQTPGAIFKRKNGQRHLTPSGRPPHGGAARDELLKGYRTPYENPLGKLPGSVWNIPSQPLQVPAHLGVDHFAAFPMELPRRIILGWSPPGVCTGCGQGRRPVRVTEAFDSPRHNGTGRKIHMASGNFGMQLGREHVHHITGYECACPQPTAPTRPARVLDPFGGTGTTALVASVLGRHGITADLSADYCRLAAWRTTDPGERARALQVPKPPPVVDGQEALFTL